MKRNTMLALVVVLGGLPALAHAQDCEEGATTAAQVRNCLSGKDDALLDKAYAETLRRARTQDATLAPKLSLAQASWLKFAQDSCEYTVASSTLQTNSNDARLMCMQTFIQARIRVLNGYQRALEQER
ncbi:hypothetical protein XcuCFBP2542_02300 [Xanthomonas cucurbitae]|uniref:Lysozyme inhibitor LprI-like N-terminal domain-containing protein n=1 Tax=Xanthomonas cucurbitae TaxID=56453 RepID=A0A2S7DXH1_9XANT|nr:lysozyme inhibitor LprI family protein [Xanthomonas cucurbitae]PPU78533.1 hypothetical protein XcuCFBP2542_02300 [Xanthomonas cucurbitae]WDM79107.1 lysozyme inhibitor LprI family protein [Xanthomonas cucurbitae]WDM82791.1 lysozyme inhibitor LprI family protein [Xanthomonas cucurbitae]